MHDVGMMGLVEQNTPKNADGKMRYRCSKENDRSCFFAGDGIIIFAKLAYIP
jgi:hypothetical protein